MKKNAIIIAAFIMVSAIVFSSCNKGDDLIFNTPIEEIIGTYSGTIVDDNHPGTVLDATAVITMGQDSSIQFHCFAENFDTTMMLNIFQHEDSMMVCNTGQDFFNEYGHHQSNDWDMCQGGGMMGHNHGTAGNSNYPMCDWEDHMTNEHNPGDRHYGGFNMQDHSFSYDFKMHSNGSIYFKKFRGIKK